MKITVYLLALFNTWPSFIPMAYPLTLQPGLQVPLAALHSADDALLSCHYQFSPDLH